MRGRGTPRSFWLSIARLSIAPCLMDEVLENLYYRGGDADADGGEIGGKLLDALQLGHFIAS